MELIKSSKIPTKICYDSYVYIKHYEAQTKYCVAIFLVIVC